ncbi:MAG: transglutaminase domain-containing protein [bacterium]
MNKKYYHLIVLFIVLLGCSNPTDVNYLDIIKSYPDYEYENTNHLPQFTYADSSDVNLVALKDTFNLEEIAGKGDEISQIVNLMEWVHTTIRHDGSSQNPYPRNTFNIIKVCKEENRGVNCRMLAIVLNEIYLSCGFKSRYVTCKPAEKDFDDCHVINSVYSYQL